MAKFSVQFADARGKMGSATIEAASERAVLAKIEAGGGTPVSVQALGFNAPQDKCVTPTDRPLKSHRGKITRRAVLDFTHQLTAVVESGIPIISGLKAIGEQTENQRLRAAIARIAGRIEGGRSLADAMAAEAGVFPTLYVKTVAAGEAAGKVAEVLSALARYQDQEADTRGRVRSALLYPMLVVAALVLATTFMLVFVVPQFAKMFDKFKGELPVPTKILLALSGAIVNHYLLVILGLIGSVFALRALVKLAPVKSWLDQRIFKLPVFGNLLLGVHMVRFIELLDLLMQAALPITQALRVTADSTTNAALRSDVFTMLRAVEGGRSLTDAFTQTRWFTPLVKRMLAVGEQAGRIDQIFAYLRKYYSMQTKESVKLLSTLIEPIMVTCLAVVVLFFALAIFLPMWRLLKIVGTA